MKNLVPSSIRSKLLLLGTLAFLPVMALTVCNSLYQRRILIEETQARMERVLDLAVLHDEEVVRDTHRLLAMLAEIPAIREGGHHADELLARILKGAPGYTNFGVIAPDGRLVASALPFGKPLDLSDRSYFQGAMKDKSFTMAQYTAGRITGKPILLFAYPVIDRAGNVSAVLYGSLDLSAETRFHAGIDAQTPDDSPYVRIDARGDVLSSHPSSKLFPVGQPLETSLLRAIGKEKKGTFRHAGKDGAERFYLFARYPGPLHGEGGYALLSIPTGSLFAEADRLLAINIAVLLAVCLLFLAVLWLGGKKRIIRPVELLTDATRRMAAGDLGARTGLTSDEGELGQLGQAFDGMASELQRGQEQAREMAERLRLAAANAEQERNKSEAIIAGIGDGISIQDRNYRILYQNPVQKERIGDHVGELCYKVYGGREAVCEDCSLTASFLDGKIHTVERKGPWNGREAHFEITASPLRDSSGNIVAGIEVIRDISERMRSRDALLVRETLLRQSQEVARLGHYIFDIPAGAWSCSEMLDEVFGIPTEYPKTVEGWLEIVHPDHREEMLAYLQGHVLRDGRPFDKEYRIVRISDRTERWVHGLGNLEHGPDGSPQRMFGTIQDITDRRRMEEEKEKLRAQLQQALKMEAVGRLAGGVAHDFNNLLTAIIGNIAIAQMRLSPFDPAAKMLAEANKAADRAATLIQQLLAFSRKQIVEPKVLDLNRMIGELHSMLVRLIREDIEIRCSPGDARRPVKIDAAQFQQVLINLVVNARDAMPNGGTIVIETENVELDGVYCARHPYVRPGRYVMLAVSDTGHGMTDEVKAHIFEPFFTTKPKGSGTGLGLATAYGVVKQAGGSIEVYSEAGKGTTIRIYLPRVEDAVQEAKAEAHGTVLSGGNETVMLVEDEEMVRDISAAILGKLGYKVLQAANGKQAIAMAREYAERIDLLMTDVVMPGMNGRELSVQMQDIHPETRVLFASGYTEEAIVHQGVLDEGVSFISKPFSPPALAKKIRDVLENGAPAA